MLRTFRFFVIFLFCYVTDNVSCAYQIHGKVFSGSGQVENIKDAEIYEEYGDDKTVAITDEKGEFIYETASDVPVKLWARKKGFINGRGYSEESRSLVISKGNTENVMFELIRWENPETVRIIYTDEDDKDCVINQAVTLENACNNKINGYKKNLFDESVDCDDAPYAAYWPNKDGVIIIPNFSVGTGIRFGTFVQEFDTFPSKNTVYRPGKRCPEKIRNEYKKGQSIVEGFASFSEGFARAFNSQSHPLEEAKQKFVKYQGTEEEFVDEQIRLAYKFCPRILEEWQKHKRIPGCDGTGSGDITTDDSTSVSSIDLEALKKVYEDAKANEQSLANRTLTAASIAATGVGGMELAMGLSEQKADKEAQQDMSAYIASFRCEYGNGKQVKAGPEEIVLPGGNDEKLMSLRTQYMTLAADLKERKDALGMKPGIESEEILDKTAMNLYDDEKVGIESGAYGSLYRAKMLNSEEDQAKIEEEAKKSKNRVIGGAVAAGAGVVGGVIGNTLINDGVGIKTPDEDKVFLRSISSDSVNKEYTECLSKIKINDKTKDTDLYAKVSDFCSRYFPNEQDCTKVMFATEYYKADIDVLLANNYDFNFYKNKLNGFCYSNDDTTSIEFFDEYFYSKKIKKEKYNELNNWLKSCFKKAGAMDYLDFYSIEQSSKIKEENLNINYDSIDCFKLDEEKTQNDIIVKGNHIKDYIKPNLDVDTFILNMKKLLGSYADYINIIDTEE